MPALSMPAMHEHLARYVLLPSRRAVHMNLSFIPSQ